MDFTLPGIRGHRRAQGAAEYLVLMAIVLVIALILLVLLMGIPAGHGDVSDTQSKAYWGGVAWPFSIGDNVQVNGTFMFSLANRGTERLVLRKVQIGNITADFGPGWVFKPSGLKNIAISGLAWCNETSYDSYEYNVTFIYDTENIDNRTQIGDKPIVGRCSFP